MEYVTRFSSADSLEFCNTPDSSASFNAYVSGKRCLWFRIFSYSMSSFPQLYVFICHTT